MQAVICRERDMKRTKTVHDKTVDYLHRVKRKVTFLNLQFLTSMTAIVTRVSPSL
jgi:hypothetical protein